MSATTKYELSVEIDYDEVKDIWSGKLRSKQFKKTKPSDQPSGLNIISESENVYGAFVQYGGTDGLDIAADHRTTGYKFMQMVREAATQMLKEQWT